MVRCEAAIARLRSRIAKLVEFVRVHLPTRRERQRSVREPEATRSGRVISI